MIRYPLTLALLSSVLFGLTDAELKEEIVKAKEEKKQVDAKLKALSSELLKRKLDRSFLTHTELGFSQTSGNTDTQSFNLEMNIKKNWKKHHATMLIDAQYAKDNDIESKNKYLLELNYNYDLSSKLAFGYLFGYKDDKFSGYDYQLYTGPGLKYQFIDEDKHNLFLDANLLYSQDKDSTTNITNNYISYRVLGNYSWQVLDNLKFNQILSYRSKFDDADNFFVFSKSGFSINITNMVSAGISYKLDYVNQPANGLVNTDDTISANLIVDY
ncbi:MAG: DUF481 domain-containing protein [Campylobacterales bacterium]|nr:DUF481 domain-containing protein [Campylobacterales bacterium]